MNYTGNLNNICLVCSGKKTHYNFSLNKFRIEECEGCGLMRLNPQPSDDELAKIYNSNYFINLDNSNGAPSSALLKSKTADDYLDQIASYSGISLTGSLLEIGCGQGDFLVKAAERGLKVTGIEYSEHAVKVAAKKLGNGGKIIKGDISVLLNSPEKFNYIVFADVLEHVRNPREFLSIVHSLLQENGIAIAIVPSLDSRSAQWMKNKWVEFKVEHLWYFSQVTIRQLMYREGFGEVKSVPAKKTLNFDYIAQHFIQYPVQPYSKILSLLKAITPSALKKLPFKVVASGIVTFAKKQQIASVKKLSVIMAAYNEEATLKSAIDRVLGKKIPGIVIELIIVESNSTDNTRKIVLEYQNDERVIIILQDKPQGKGHAIRAGLERISGDFVLIQDADDEYDIEDYDVLIEPLMTGEAAFVLGARHGGRAWKMRKFNTQKLTGHFLNLGHWCFTLLINVFFNLKLKDPFTMYKVFRADCLRGIKFSCNRFDFDHELLIKLAKNGYKPIEIPVNYRSRTFKEGKKVRMFYDPLTWIKAIIKFRFAKI